MLNDKVLKAEYYDEEEGYPYLSSTTVYSLNFKVKNNQRRARRFRMG